MKGGENLKTILGADLRSLALFRISLAALVIADLIARSFDLRAHYTDEGVLPRWVALRYLSDWPLSLHMLSGLWQLQAALFILAGLVALAMLLGYRTRAATVVLWLLTLSLQARNPLLLYGADVLIRMMLFWAMFLPLGARWSIDRLRDREQQALPRNIISAGTIALLLQVIIMYFFTVLLKSGTTWKDGSAIYYALSVDYMVSGFGKMWLDYPSLLKWGTFAVYYLELFGPFLLLSPFFPGPVRTAVCFAFVLLHVAFGTSLEVGLFPCAGSTIMLALLPSWFWDRLPGLARLSWLARACGRLAEFVASRLGKYTRRSKSSPPRIQQTYLGGALCLFFLAYVLIWNISGLEKSPVAIPERAVWIGQTLGLHQSWDMFAPDPMLDDGWYVIPAELSDGTKVDLVTDRLVTFKKPELVSDLHWSDRWQEFFHNMWYRRHAWSLGFFGRYLCREWNQTHPPDQHLETFDIYYMLEKTTAPGTEQPLEKIHLWEHDCR